MAKKDIEKIEKNSPKRKYERREPKEKNIKDETFRSIVAILLFVAAFILMMGAFSKAGWLGNELYSLLDLTLFGIGYYLIPLILVILGIAFLKDLDRKISMSKLSSGLLFFLSSLTLLAIWFTDRGGSVGSLLSRPMLSLLDSVTSSVLLLALILISVLVIFDTHLGHAIGMLWGKLFTKKEYKEEDFSKKIKQPEEVAIQIPEEEKKVVSEQFKDTSKNKKITKKDEEENLFSSAIILRNRAYVPPPLTLLEVDSGKPGTGDIKANANIIKRTLHNFGINVEMDEITIGPTVTRYALKPAEGVKLSRIIGLQDNLALALAAETIRIEAPIPGKSLVGIEVPNTSKTIVGLGSLIGATEFVESNKPLLVAIGKDVSGKPTFYDLAKMPHLLIAGTTGSGKSVTVHSILNSLLYRNSPDMLKFIMVDAKRVELTLYNKIPHLMTPVITDAKKTILALKWAAKEMDRRYDVLEKESVRDIDSYHKNIVLPALKNKKDNGVDGSVPETMPYLVIVIDELADLMQAYPRELEAAIVRLAQMSRAVGIHLILSTQRPSVNVITGLIKANIPTRIALKVGSQIDSRTIIDKAGAEKLVGQGDMLFVSQDRPDPARIQSPYISEGEVKKVVKYLIDSYKDELPEPGLELTAKPSEETEGRNPIFDGSMSSDEDDLYEDARAIVIEAKKASTSYIQRKLRIGYSRAASLMDMLEERGVIGPADGSRPREIIGVGPSEQEEGEIESS
ncbi:MAG: DNA translocase FtsK 4TM domain-containing protein [Candidatus Paceibacterota bacterium]